MKRTFVVLAVLAPLAALACEKSGQDYQQKADKAQAQANQEITNATVESNKKVDNAQAKADDKIAEAEKDFAKKREDYRHSMQSNLDDLDKKIADAEVKAKKATGKTKAEIETNLPGVRSRRDAFATDIKTIDTANATTFDATKARIDKEWSDLKKSEDTID